MTQEQAKLSSQLIKLGWNPRVADHISRFGVPVDEWISPHGIKFSFVGAVRFAIDPKYQLGGDMVSFETKATMKFGSPFIDMLSKAFGQLWPILGELIMEWLLNNPETVYGPLNAAAPGGKPETLGGDVIRHIIAQILRNNRDAILALAHDQVDVLFDQIVAQMAA